MTESRLIREWIESYGESSRFWDWMWDYAPFDAVWRAGDSTDTAFEAGVVFGETVAENPKPVYTYSYKNGDPFKFYFIGTEEEILQYLKNCVKNAGIRRPAKTKNNRGG